MNIINNWIDMNFLLFRKKIKDVGVSVNDFAELTRTPAPTIYGWKRAKKNEEGGETPGWVDPFMELYEQNKKLKETVNELLIRLCEQSNEDPSKNCSQASRTFINTRSFQ